MADFETKYENLKILHTIAVKLNSEVDLKKSMQLTLESAISLMDLKTAWIWLLAPDSKTVYLAASHNLPPAFTHHPERLSGWCYCIEKYLSDASWDASNISEITCSRLKDIEGDAEDLKYHSTIPLYENEQKIGLLNILSKTSLSLNENQLSILNSIGDLLSAAITRARAFEKGKASGVLEERKRLSKNLEKNLLSNIKTLQEKLSTKAATTDIESIKKMLEDLIQNSNKTISELQTSNQQHAQKGSFQFPFTPLTKRELEVLNLLKTGNTNKAIAEQLFISERTVKFHVSSLFSKLNASNRTEAVQISITRGLIQL